MNVQRLNHTGVATRRPIAGRHVTPLCSVAVAAESSAAAPSVAEPKKGPLINVIPRNGSSPNGVPAVMGAHLMASGIVAPVSTSNGPGDGPPHQFRYPTVEGSVDVLLHTTAAKASASLVKIVAEAAIASVKARGAFTLVLSGGSLPESLVGLAKAKGIPWDKVWVFFLDERNVPLSSDDSNYKQLQEAFLSKVPVPSSQVFPIAEHMTVLQAAKVYEGALLSLPTAVLPRTLGPHPLPVFDLVLLGVGPDGHVASLFPNAPQLTVTDHWIVGVSGAPKSPPERISMTMEVINAANDVVFAAMGEAKAEVVQRVMEVQALPGALPAQMVRPTSGKLRWVLDVASADGLDIAAWGTASAFPRSQ